MKNVNKGRIRRNKGWWIYKGQRKYVRRKPRVKQGLHWI